MKAKVKVIFLVDFKSFQAGSIVKVSGGYARNFLKNNGIVKYATPDVIADFKEQQDVFSEKNKQQRISAESLVSSMSESFFTIIRVASDDGRLYGSVSTADICKLFANNSEAAGFKPFPISRGDVDLGMGIKTIGIHSCRIFLHGNIALNVLLNVCRTEAEGELAKERFKREKEEKKKIIDAEASAESYKEQSNAKANTADNTASSTTEELKIPEDTELKKEEISES